MARKKVEIVLEIDEPVKRSKDKDPMAAIFKVANFIIPPVSEMVPNEDRFYLDSGSYAINALVSGSIYEGIRSDTIFGLAGEKSTGKTFLALDMCKHFLTSHPTGRVFYFDSEGAIETARDVECRDIPTNRFHLREVQTIEDFRLKAASLIKGYLTLPKEERPPMIVVLDSLGMLSTEKEMAESTVELDKIKKDMTKAQLVKSVFRVLTISFRTANVPLIVTNHTYEKIGAQTKPGMPPPREMGGGEGLKYAASTVIFLGKKTVYNEAEKEITGNLLTTKLYKSRFTREGLSANALLDHGEGLDRYFGLFEIAKKYGVIVKDGNGFRWPDGQFCYTKNVLDDPQKFYTEANLKLIDEKVQAAWTYGKNGSKPVEVETDDIEEDITFNVN